MVDGVQRTSSVYNIQVGCVYIYDPQWQWVILYLWYIYYYYYDVCLYIGVICVVKSINPTLYLSIVTAVTGYAAAV